MFPKTALLGPPLVLAASLASASWYGQYWALSSTPERVIVKGFSENTRYDGEQCREGCGGMEVFISLGDDLEFVALTVDEILHCGGHRPPPSRRWPSCRVTVTLGDFEATWASDRISRHIVHLSGARTEALRKALLGLEFPAYPPLLIRLDRTVYRFPSLGAVHALRDAERLTGAKVLN